MRVTLLTAIMVVVSLASAADKAAAAIFKLDISVSATEDTPTYAGPNMTAFLYNSSAYVELTIVSGNKTRNFGTAEIRLVPQGYFAKGKDKNSYYVSGWTGNSTVQITANPGDQILAKVYVATSLTSFKQAILVYSKPVTKSGRQAGRIDVQYGFWPWCRYNLRMGFFAPLR